MQTVYTSRAWMCYSYENKTFEIKVINLLHTSCFTSHQEELKWIESKFYDIDIFNLTEKIGFFINSTEQTIYSKWRWLKRISLIMG